MSTTSGRVLHISQLIRYSIVASNLVKLYRNPVLILCGSLEVWKRPLHSRSSRATVRNNRTRGSLGGPAISLDDTPIPCYYLLAAGTLEPTRTYYVALIQQTHHHEPQSVVILSDGASTDYKLFSG